ncbi:hypothetical protein GO491_02230 [Flavobacteriaceae bacterium Ap0902]|nr:hypothetical protein [Flavobacteriaceae bacterium Ap0902]
MLQILEERWGTRIEMIEDWERFIQLNEPKLNYSEQIDEGSIQIKPHGLLFNQGIKFFDFSELETDALAMIFFLLSRYEEYVIAERDMHKRFSAKSSYLYHTKRLHRPYTDILIQNLKHKVNKKYPLFNFKNNQFKSEFTIDIDQAFHYQQKSFRRFVGANIRDALKLHWRSVLDRKLTYFHLMKDPWNIYADLKQKSKKKTTLPIFFFLVGDYGRFNKNISYKNAAFQQVIKEINSWAHVGVHPSYNAGEDLATIQTEKTRLEGILNKSINHSRQHYIQLSLPETYLNLISSGIKNDYSMGFADEIGFRAGTAFPFDWYDLINEEITNLKVHPFCAMDVTLKNYLNLSIEEANEILTDLKEEIKKVNGTFSIISHNESLSNYAEWKGWGMLFLKYWD